MQYILRFNKKYSLKDGLNKIKNSSLEYVIERIDNGNIVINNGYVCHKDSISYLLVLEDNVTISKLFIKDIINHAKTIELERYSLGLDNEILSDIYVNENFILSNTLLDNEYVIHFRNENNFISYREILNLYKDYVEDELGLKIDLEDINIQVTRTIDNRFINVRLDNPIPLEKKGLIRIKKTY